MHYVHYSPNTLIPMMELCVHTELPNTIEGDIGMHLSRKRSTRSTISMSPGVLTTASIADNTVNPGAATFVI